MPLELKMYFIQLAALWLQKLQNLQNESDGNLDDSATTQKPISKKNTVKNATCVMTMTMTMWMWM